MFKELKTTIRQSAIEVVELAENVYSPNEGDLKKQAAIAYVNAKIKLHPILKPFVLKLLSNVIDEAIETAVRIYKRRQTK